jgi:hypothetical protein
MGPDSPGHCALAHGQFSAYTRSKQGEVVVMAQARTPTKNPISRAEVEDEAGTPLAIAPEKHHKRYIPPLWRHFLEMNAAMWVGMALGAVISRLLFAAFGTSIHVAHGSRATFPNIMHRNTLSARPPGD